MEGQENILHETTEHFLGLEFKKVFYDGKNKNNPLVKYFVNGEEVVAFHCTKTGKSKKELNINIIAYR